MPDIWQSNQPDVQCGTGVPRLHRHRHSHYQSNCPTTASSPWQSGADGGADFFDISHRPPFLDGLILGRNDLWFWKFWIFTQCLSFVMLTKRYGCASEQAHLRHFQSVSETVGFYIRPVQKLDEPSVYLNDSCSLSVAQRTLSKLIIDLSG